MQIYGRGLYITTEQYIQIEEQQVFSSWRRARALYAWWLSRPWLPSSPRVATRIKSMMRRRRLLLLITPPCRRRATPTNTQTAPTAGARLSAAATAGRSLEPTATTQIPAAALFLKRKAAIAETE